MALVARRKQEFYVEALITPLLSWIPYLFDTLTWLALRYEDPAAHWRPLVLLVKKAVDIGNKYQGAANSRSLILEKDKWQKKKFIEWEYIESKIYYLQGLRPGRVYTNLCIWIYIDEIYSLHSGDLMNTLFQGLVVLNQQELGGR